VRSGFIASAAIAATAVLAGGCEKDEPAPEASDPPPPAERATALAAAAELRADLASSLRAMRATVEPSCPPPAVIGCRPSVRLVGELRAAPSARLRRDLAGAVRAALRRLGFRRVHVHQRVRQGRLGGRAVARDETLARWRMRAGLLRLSTVGVRP
jgi:hypothetical protein